MKRVLIGAFLMILMISMIFSFGCSSSTPKYEYMIVSPDDYTFTTEMNEYGEEGWQLVFARRASDSSDIMSYEIILMREL